MKIIFWGTSQFALPSLEKLASSEHRIVSVVTQPDKRRGRHLRISPGLVKVRAEELNLVVVQPQDPDTEDFIGYLRSLSSDLFVVVSYGKILKKKILEIPRLYCINLHASLLPKYRGATPINWAILNGETQTGLTIIRMTEKMDAGDILRQEKLTILEEDTSISLGERLSKKGADILGETLNLIAEGKVEFIPQDENLVSFAPSLKKENGRISWHNTAGYLHNQVRALQPWPGAYCLPKDRLVKLWKTRVVSSDSSGEPGKIIAVARDGVVVATGRGDLLIEELQMAGGKRMSAEKFLLGHRLNIGECLG